MEEKRISIIENASRAEAFLYVHAKEIQFHYNDLSLTENNELPFFALRKIRGTLEVYNIFLLINGARRDVWTSGLLSNTFGAYVLKTGKPGLAADVVNIYGDVEDPSMIGTIAEQEQYHKEWIQSLMNSSP